MIQLLTHISEHCSTIFIWPDQSNQNWCHNGTFISFCQPCYDLPFPMVQLIDPAMTSLAKNGGRWKHYCCCWLLPGGDPILNLWLSACFMCVNLHLHMGICAESVDCHLLSHAGFLAKNQMPDQALQWIRIPGIVHLNPDEPERVLCWKSDVKTSPSVQVWLRMWPVDTVPFRMRQILPGRPCRGGQGYYRPMEIPGPRLNVKTVFPRYGDSHVKDKMVMSCKDPLFA